MGLSSIDEPFVSTTNHSTKAKPARFSTDSVRYRHRFSAVALFGPDTALNSSGKTNTTKPLHTQFRKMAAPRQLARIDFG